MARSGSVAQAEGVKSLSTRSIAIEHTALRESSRRILALLDGATCACGANGCAKCLREDTRSFARRIRQHFEVEEAAWRTGDAASDASTRKWIESLVRQHRDLDRRLESVCSRLEGARSPGTAAAAGVSAALRGILGDLIEHELSEARLFQRSVFEGWGRCD
jgi:hypothetical protein